MHATNNEQQTTFAGDAARLSLAIAAWLQAKRGRSGSRHTAVSYETTLDAFRAALQSEGLDLDADPRMVALALKAWCERGDPSPATYNHRLSVMSSFYTFAARRGLLPHMANPAALIERRKAPERHATRPLEPAKVRELMAAIDRSTPAGARDYALLAVALSTGLRPSEIAGMRWRHVTFHGDNATLDIPRAKGGETKRIALPPAVGRALRDWLYAKCRSGFSPIGPDTPVWTTLASAPGSRPGDALKMRQLWNICRERLGANFNALRHTFAVAAGAIDAPIASARQPLGHSRAPGAAQSPSAPRSAENQFSAGVEEMFPPHDEDGA